MRSFMPPFLVFRRWAAACLSPREKPFVWRLPGGSPCDLLPTVEPFVRPYSSLNFAFCSAPRLQTREASASTTSSRRERLLYDAVIVGGGPAGLAAAIRLKQIAAAQRTSISVCLIEKAAALGGHIVSGSVLKPSALDELLPGWRILLRGEAPSEGRRGDPLEGVSVEPHASASASLLGAVQEGQQKFLFEEPLTANAGAFPQMTPVTQDRLVFLLDAKHSVSLPRRMMPSVLRNEGNFIISLGALCRWLGAYAEALGVDVFPGYAAAELLLQRQKGEALVPLSAVAPAAIRREGWYVSGVRTADCGLGPHGKPLASFTPGVDVQSNCLLIAEGVKGSLAEQVVSAFDLRQETLCPTKYGLGLKEVWMLPPSARFPGRVLHTLGWPLYSRAFGGGFAYETQGGCLSIGLVISLDYKDPYLNPYLEFQRFKSHPILASLLVGARCISYGAKCVSEGGWQAIPKLAFPGGMLLGDSAGFLNVPAVKGVHLAMRSGIIAAQEAAEFLRSEAPAPKTAQPRVPVGYETAVRQSKLWQELHSVRDGLQDVPVEISLKEFAAPESRFCPAG
ncbi:electron transfer flavoprotein-ubiquinone oxidoreductase [Cyclospora cayetanensis]|uniref:Electron transfer flavoprotein-ubiquinone oxidoreductase n=1 Tax=Cyclospora cayetanensis TaxID=88456 RepID=A0A1D3CXL1_9EIME|nr:electron transfer flavoprotein-ubiquinone oxidoreductase [Cyclospora cayetanensis]